MEIKEKKISDSHKCISIFLEEIDYDKEYNLAINKYSKTISLKGFRKGYVPKGLVRKLYGKSILAEELNKILSHKLNDYILSKKYQIIGEPLPVSRIREDEMVFGNKIECNFYFL